MRGSSLKIIEHWAVHESHVLPFLAPAVFAPWLYPLQHQSVPSVPLEISRSPFTSCDSTARTSNSEKTRSSVRRYGRHSLQRASGPHDIKSLSTPVGCRHFTSCVSGQKENCAINHVPIDDHMAMDLALENRKNRSRGLKDAGEVAKALTEMSNEINRGEFAQQEEQPIITLTAQDDVIEKDCSLRERFEKLRLRASLADKGAKDSHTHLSLQSKHSQDIEMRRSTLVDVSSTWTEGIARLTTRLNTRLSDNKRGSGKPVNLLSDRKTAWVESLPPIGSSGSQIQDVWRRLSIKLRERYWPIAMLFYLEHSISHALTFLNATIMDPLPSPPQIAGSIHVIASSFRQTATGSTSADLELLLSTIQKVLEHYTTPPTFTVRSLRLLLQLLPQRAESFLTMLQNSQVRVHHNLLLHFAITFANSGELKQSVHALKIAIAHGADTNSHPVLHLCSRLLRLSRGKEGNYQESSSIVAAFFDMGIRLNIVMFNILLLNASEAGDPGTAWGIYKMIRKNNVELDEYTYSIMMKMCRKTNEKQQFRYLYFELNPENKKIHPVMVTEILACRYHFNIRSNFDHLLRFYERHCDLRPLQDLGIVALDHEIRHEAQPYELQESRPSPCAGTLGIMLLAYVRRSQRMDEIEHIYENFQRLLKEENPCILPLLTTTHTFNVFFKAYSRSSGSLARWRNMLRDMVQPLPPHLVNRETGAPLERAPPDAQTWNIILNGLARAGQHADAKRLIKVMEINNFKPDLVTWNSLLTGLARQQRSFDVSKVLQKMEHDDFKPDLHTRQALLHLKNQSRLVKRFSKRMTGPTNVQKRYRRPAWESTSATDLHKFKAVDRKKQNGYKPYLMMRWKEGKHLDPITQSLIRDTQAVPSRKKDILQIMKRKGRVKRYAQELNFPKRSKGTDYEEE